MLAKSLTVLCKASQPHPAAAAAVTDTAATRVCSCDVTVCPSIQLPIGPGSGGRGGAPEEVPDNRNLRPRHHHRHIANTFPDTVLGTIIVYVVDNIGHAAMDRTCL